MPKCALPDHLREKLHTDWPFFARWIPRGWSAFGPRCGMGNEGYKSWPPVLVRGHGVSRWESDGAESIIEIPYLSNITVWGSDIYGKTFRVIETNPNNKFFNTEFDLVLDYKEGLYQKTYSPSAIQEFSPLGNMHLYPKYECYWKVLSDKWTLNVSHGFRPDHVDLYYNRRIFYMGLAWE